MHNQFLAEYKTDTHLDDLSLVSIGGLHRSELHFAARQIHTSAVPCRPERTVAGVGRVPTVEVGRQTVGVYGWSWRTLVVPPTALIK